MIYTEQIRITTSGEKLTTKTGKRKTFRCQERDTRSRKYLQGTHWVLLNYIRAERQFRCNETVTFTTQGDHVFLDNVIPIVTRWKGPVSVSIYSPGDDYIKALEMISYYRYENSSFDTVMA